MGVKFKMGDCIKAAQEADGLRVIVHCCNDIGGWGSGFVLSLNDAFGDVEEPYKSPKAAYLAWCNAGVFGPKRTPFKLGNAQFCTVAQDLFVCNMIGQRGVGLDKYGNPPIRYDAFKDGFIKIAKVCSMMHEEYGVWPSIYMPLIGCGLAGGKLDKVMSIVRHCFLELPEVDISVYAFTQDDYDKYADLFTDVTDVTGTTAVCEEK